jgi:hypothetical protein
MGAAISEIVATPLRVAVVTLSRKSKFTFIALYSPQSWSEQCGNVLVAVAAILSPHNIVVFISMRK